MARYLQQIYYLCKQHDIPATFFEITTTLAFLYFQQCHETMKQQLQLHSCQKSIVILEAGLGGRLDATNVVSVPALTILTSVGLDHTNILGRSLDKIAREKAGIIKANIPCLVGPQVPHETVRKFVQQQEHLSLDQLHFLVAEEDTQAVSSASNNEDVSALETTTSDYDKVNTRIAMEAIQLLQRSPRLVDFLPHNIPMTLLEKGTSLRPSCRFEIVPLEYTTGRSIIILDVAHNPAAMKCLVSKLHLCVFNNNNANANNNNRATPTKVRFLLGLSKDKDWRGIFKALLPLMTPHTDDDGAILSKIHLAQADHPKSFPLESLVAELQTLQLPCAKEKYGMNSMLEYNVREPSVTRQLNLALHAAAAQEGREVVVVCGSVHLMAEARHCLGIQEPRDSKYLVGVATGTIPTSHGARYGNSDPAV